MGNQPAYQEEDRLIELYHGREWTIHKIADHFDISTATVYYWMEKHDIQRRYTGTLEERFNQYYEVDEDSGCWEWQNEPGTWGYGKIWDEGRQRLAHRVSWELNRDEDLPEFSPEQQLNHTCHNRMCVNPGHLYLGTQQENVDDAVENESWGEDRRRGSGIGNSKLSEEQVREIKRRCDNGETQKDVSEDYPVSHSTVNQIMVGNQWQHVTLDEEDSK